MILAVIYRFISVKNACRSKYLRIIECDGMNEYKYYNYCQYIKNEVVFIEL